MGLIIRSSHIHSAGCYTTSFIREGTHVVEYTGPRVTKEAGDDLYDGKDITYLFGLDGDELVIDGHGTAAFINHSCDPNCETDQIDGRVWIIALRDIQPGEELTYDYQLYDGDGEAPCWCGAANCRGTMYEDAEIEKQNAEKKPQAKGGSTALPAKSGNGKQPEAISKPGSGNGRSSKEPSTTTSGKPAARSDKQRSTR